MRKIALQSRGDFFLRIRSLGRFFGHSTTPRAFHSATRGLPALAKVLGPSRREESPRAAAMNFLHATAPAGVAVTVSARLHLGFLDLNGEFGRQFGSLGLSISETARTPHIASRQRGSGPLAGLGVRVSRCNAKRRCEPEATPPQSRR